MILNPNMYVCNIILLEEVDAKIIHIKSLQNFIYKHNTKFLKCTMELEKKGEFKRRQINTN